MNEGFVKVPTAFILASAGRLSSNAFRVVVAVKMHARKDRDPYPSVQTIAKEVGLSKRTVERAIAELRENGLKARGRGRSNAYQVDEFMEELGKSSCDKDGPQATSGPREVTDVARRKFVEELLQFLDERLDLVSRIEAADRRTEQ